MKLFASLLVPVLDTRGGAGAGTGELSFANGCAHKKDGRTNSKLDALSQQILKMEQQMSRPGVMVGEATPVPNAAPVAAASSILLMPVPPPMW